MRKVAAILVFVVLALRAVVPALPMYVCSGMGAAHLDHPCCAGSQDAERPTWNTSCCKPEQSVAVAAVLPPGKPALAVFAAPALAALTCVLPALPELTHVALLPARASPWPLGPPPSLRSILRI